MISSSAVIIKAEMICIVPELSVVGRIAAPKKEGLAKDHSLVR